MNNDYYVPTPVRDMVMDGINKTETVVEKAEDWKLPLKFKILFPIIQLLPVVFVLLSFCSFRVPEFKWYTPLLIILALVPTIAVYFFLMTKSGNKRRRAVAIILCVLYLPVSLILSLVAFPHSRTTDINDYREFDTGVTASIIFELFPEAYSRDITIDKYYYHYDVELGEVYYDIYAECVLPQSAFGAEVSRVKERWNDAPTIRHGDYDCLILHPTYEDEDVFDRAGIYGLVVIFAYDEDSGRIRYIASRSEFYRSTCYYQQLDWE